MYRVVLGFDTVPAVQLARALQAPLQKELLCMEKASMIWKMDERTDWVSPLVNVRKKDGSLRVCMDPRNVNACLKFDIIRCRNAEISRTSFPV